ncbi:MAG TPA: ribonuclease E/G [Caulobacteraceae bacterium]|nr:ribonuclease E/G [Caulobacteraceae bacterium]
MAERALYLDEGPGETRGVVTLGDAPERLLIERAGQRYPELGARYGARVSRVDRGLGLAWLDLDAGEEAVLRLKADRAIPVEGQSLEIEIAIEPQDAKAAVARVLGDGRGPLGLLSAAPDLAGKLSLWGPGLPIIGGRQARDMADEAQAQALAVEHPLRSGGSIAIQLTRALVAVDVDLGAAGGRDAKRAARQTNLAAIRETARLLRLKGQGGLVVVDLIGRGHDGQALATACRSAFAPEQPGLVLGPVSRFGTIELAIPRRYRPLADILCDAEGRLSATTLALGLLRAVEREASADPGGRITARASPIVVAAALAPAEALRAKIGARFELIADPALRLEAMETASR